MMYAVGKETFLFPLAKITVANDYERYLEESACFLAKMHVK